KRILCECLFVSVFWGKPTTREVCVNTRTRCVFSRTDKLRTVLFYDETNCRGREPRGDAPRCPRRDKPRSSGPHFTRSERWTSAAGCSRFRRRYSSPLLRRRSV